MADTSVATPTEPEVADPAARSRGRLRSLPRETVLMLVVPPLLVLLVFGGYVIWRQTADARLDREHPARLADDLAT